MLWGRKPLLTGGRTKHRPASERIQHVPVPREPKGPRQHSAASAQPPLGNGPCGCSNTQNAALGCPTHTKHAGSPLQPALPAITCRPEQSAAWLTPLLRDNCQIKNKPSWTWAGSFGWRLRAGLGPEQGNIRCWGLQPVREPGARGPCPALGGLHSKTKVLVSKT